MRQLNIGTKALEYLPTSASPPALQQLPATQELTPGSSASPPRSEPRPEVTAHWMDKFGELARAHNEEWREELLARALAAESSAPGTVSPRALWLFGTLEERAFMAFATLLDLASFIGSGLMIPHFTFRDRPIPDCVLGAQTTMSQLIFQIGEVGLVADTLSTSRTFKKGQGPFIASYGKTAFMIQCELADLSVTGVIPTSLGRLLASFHQPKINPLGQEIFDSWIASLDKNLFSIYSAPSSSPA